MPSDFRSTSILVLEEGFLLQTKISFERKLLRSINYFIKTSSNLTRFTFDLFTFVTFILCPSDSVVDQSESLEESEA
jgi:hypothetical protein